MALVILGMAAAGVLLPFAGGATVQAEGMRRTLAAKLANDLMEQIVATPFEVIKTTWDYDAGEMVWKRAEPQGQVKDASGTVFSDAIYAKFSREATCEALSYQGVDFVLIKVRVARDGREIVTLSRRVNL